MTPPAALTEDLAPNGVVVAESLPPKGNMAEDIAAPNGVIIVEDEEAPNDAVAAPKIEEPMVSNAGAGEEKEAKEKKVTEEEEAKEKERWDR